MRKLLISAFVAVCLMMAVPSAPRPQIMAPIIAGGYQPPAVCASPGAGITNVGCYLPSSFVCAGGCSNGGSILTWVDLSGTNNNLVQGAFPLLSGSHATAPALWEGAQINGLPGALFDGSTSSYAFQKPFSFYDGNGNVATIFVVAKATGAGAILGGIAQAANVPLIYRAHSTSQQGLGLLVDTCVSYGATWSGTTAADTSWHQMNAVYVGSGDATFRIDEGSDGASSAGDTVEGLETALGVQSCTAAEYYPGYISAFIVFIGGMTTMQVEAKETLLNAMFGI